MDNYRPITVLPICSKIFERCIYVQLTNFLETNKLLSDYQFGFRSARNTESAVTLFTDEIRLNMNNSKLTGSIFIDLSKAFDTLSHAQILKNLSSSGVQGVEYELFQSYLFNRKQSVIYEATTGDSTHVTSGVPQGSILGPLLFLISYDGLGEVLRHCKLIMYADDTVIYTSDKSIATIKANLTEDFERVANWLEQNQLIINLKKGKTECMLFGTPQRTKSQILDIAFTNRTLSETKSYKYLGVQLDQSLNIKEHTSQIYKKVCGRIQLLKRLRSKLTRKTALTIYQSMILPLMTYCSTVTYSNESFMKKVNSLHLRAVKIATTSQNSDNLPFNRSIDVIMKKYVCKQVFLLLKSEPSCEAFKNYFDLMKNKTRNKNTLLRLPNAKIEAFKRSFYFHGARTFNNLPSQCRASTSLSEFLINFDKINF